MIHGVWASLAFGQSAQFSFDPNGNLVVQTAEILASPQILSQPQAQVAAPGALASFFVVAANTRGLTYQWKYNGVNIDGATGDALLVQNVGAVNEGEYTVELTNGSGSVTSAAATLRLDGDGDGMPDSWEQTHFGGLSPTTTGDFDADGVSNREEFLDGTDPANPASLLFRLTVVGDGGSVSVVPAKPAYAAGEVVTLTATAFAPNTFHGWTGAATTQSNPLNLTITSHITVRAVFTSIAPPPGLVGWWRGQGTALDAMGVNHGTATNGATYGEGKVGQGFVFDGANDHVLIPDAPALRPESITLEAWASFNALSGPIIARAYGTGLQNSYLLYLEGGTLKGFIRDAGGGFGLLTHAFTPVFDQWYHLGFSFDNVTKQVSLYLDGVRVATSQSNRVIGYDNHPVLLGGDIDNGVPGFPLKGRIDEAAIYNRALTPEEMSAIHAAGLGGKSFTNPYFTSPAELADLVPSSPYSRQVTAVLGTGPITYSVVAGSLPAGLTLSSAGLISGIPTGSGGHTLAIRATDALGASTEQVLSVLDFQQAMPAGIVAWWRAEANARDAAGANHGVATNGATYAAGKVGQSFRFDGVNDYVTVPDAPALRPASITLEAWVMFNAATGPIIARPVGSGIADSYILWLAEGNLNGIVGDVDGSGATLRTPFAPVFGQWYHLAYSFDDGSKQQALYVNGVRVISGQSNRSIGYDDHPVLIGGDIDNGTPSFLLNGRIDEAAIYNRALTPDEVAAIYHSGTRGKRLLTPVEQWKLTYFGDVEAPDSGDPDSDGHSNLFEFTAGLDPTDPLSRFTFRIEVDGETGMRLVFAPRFNDRTYTVTTREDLGPGLWLPLVGATTLDNGLERTVFDPNSSAPAQKFFRLEITAP